MKLPRPSPALGIFAIASTVFLASPIRMPTDSRFSPLVSEALVRHGSFRLDNWFFPQQTDLPYQVEVIRGHVYSLYPPGAAVLAAPFIEALSMVGLSAVGPDGRYDERGDVIVQAALAALLMGVLTVLFLRMALEILPPLWAWVVALGGALGTQIWSTASRALWGDTFLTLILGAVVWMLVLHETGKRRLSAPLLGTLMAWAYFCRPTASITILAVSLYLALNERALLPTYVATGAAWLVGFVAWSWLTFGTMLPTYYRIRTFGFATLAEGLLGILISPSRGQLIFVPATLFVIYILIRYARSLPLSRLVAPALVAIFGHLALIASFPQWHGGHCFGPRYMTAMVPWMVLLAALGLHALRDRRARGMRLELTAGVVLLACSVLVQARGACVRETWTWNVIPNDISVHPERVWRWRDCQILAGVLPSPSPSVIPRYLVGARLAMDSVESRPYLLAGWSGRENGLRWTDGKAAEVVFGLESVEPLVLEMELSGFLPRHRASEQRVEVELNGKAVTTWHVDRAGIMRFVAELPREQLARENRMSFRLPDAAFAAPFGLGKDPRQLAVAVDWLRLRRRD